MGTGVRSQCLPVKNCFFKMTRNPGPETTLRGKSLGGITAVSAQHSVISVSPTDPLSMNLECFVLV